MKLSRYAKYFWLCLLMIGLLMGQPGSIAAAEGVLPSVGRQDLLLPPAQLGGPANLEGWAISPAYIYLQWQDTGNEHFFWIGRWNDDAQDYEEAGWTPADVTSFDDETVTCDTVYYYLIYAGQELEDGSVEWSEPSNEVEVITPPCDGEPSIEEPTAGEEEEVTDEPVSRVGGEVRYIDLNVSIYREPGEDRGAYEEVFAYLADAIYEMSNGAHKLRRVNFYSNFDNHDRANVIWLPGPPEGECWPRAFVGGYYEPGATIEMCDFNDQEEPYLLNDADRQNAGYTLAHEMGHYYYGLLDEYGGSSVVVSQPAPSFPQPEDSPVEQSIMNDQRQGVIGTTTLGWEYFGDMSWLNFSTEANDTGNTANYRVFLASAWDVLARPPEEDPPTEEGLPPRPFYPELQVYAPPPGERPTIELPDGQFDARSDLEMVWIASGAGATAWSGAPGSSLDRTALASMAGSLPDVLVDQAAQAAEPTLDGVVRQLVIESSSSMGNDDRLDSAKAAAMQVVDNALVGDAIGVIAFDGTASEVLPLTLIADEETDKEAIKAAIDAITPGDDQAAIGDALQAALDGLQGAGIPEEILQVVYLVADGPSTTGSDPLEVASAYGEAFTPIYTFGYNTGGRSADLLQGLANQTGGLYSFVNSYQSLGEAFDTAEANVTPYVDVIINSDYGVLSEGDAISLPLIVDSTLGGVIIEIYYTGAPDTASLALFDPNGDPAEAFECLSEGEGDEEVSLCLYGLEAPSPGVWTIEMTANSDLFAVYQASGLEYEDTTTYYATAYPLNDEVTAPEPVQVEAFMFQEDLITGAVVEGFIEAPDGTFRAITLLDNGEGPDAMAEDGFYAAEFTPTMDGDYYVTIHFDNSSGEARFTEYGTFLAAGSDGKQPAYREPWPVEESFERAAEFQVIVSGYGEAPSAPETN